MQRIQLIDQLELLETFYNLLPVFRFNSAGYDVNNFCESSLLPDLVNEKDNQLILFKKANKVSPFEIKIFQLFDILIPLRDATILI